MIDIHLESLDLDADLIQRSVIFASHVARLNRNRRRFPSSEIQVALVTDQLDEIHRLRPHVMFKKRQNEMLGTCWAPYEGQRALIWISPTNHGADRERLVDTFVHELAHAYAGTVHGWTWRRIYALINPHLAVLFGESPRSFRVHSAVKRYQRRHETERIVGNSYEMYSRWDRLDEEKEAHRVAFERMTARLLRANVTP